MSLIFQRGRRLFRCNACRLVSNGSYYWCRECKFKLDIECGLRPKSIEIKKAHEHLLHLIRKPRYDERICRGCRLDCLETKYRCAEKECDYNVCFECIGLPASFKHLWDDHPVELTYESVENHEYYCDQCEASRDPGHRIYHCRICERDVHQECMNLHNVDLEMTYNWGKEFHNPDHIYIYGANPQVDPACSDCGFRCKDMCAQCLDCKFYLHVWRCGTPNETTLFSNSSRKKNYGAYQ